MIQYWIFGFEGTESYWGVCLCVCMCLFVCNVSQEGVGAERSGLWEDLSVPAAEEHHTECAGTHTQIKQKKFHEKIVSFTDVAFWFIEEEIIYTLFLKTKWIHSVKNCGFISVGSIERICQMKTATVLFLKISRSKGYFFLNLKKIAEINNKQRFSQLVE